MAFRWPWQRKGIQFITETGDPYSSASYQAYGLGGTPISTFDASKSSLLGAALNYMQTNIIEPPIVVVSKDGKPARPEVAAPILQPSAYNSEVPHAIQSEHMVRQGVGASLMFDGNAYILKVLGPRGIVGLQWIPHVWISTVLHDHDKSVIKGYRIQGSTHIIPPERMIHIRKGIDPYNPVMGHSALKSALQSIMTDNQILAYTNAIMGMPSPSGILSPSKDAPPLTADQAKTLQTSLEAQTSGKKVGRVMIFPSNLEWQQVQFSPKDMDVSIMTKLGEERVCAALGIPPIVLGLGAGLDRSTFANYEEARKAATEDFLVPLWETIAQQMTDALAPDLKGYEIRFDTNSVRALDENEERKAARIGNLFAKNIIDQAEARDAMGYEVLPIHKGIFAYMLSPTGIGGSKRVAAEARKAAEAPPSV